MKELKDDIRRYLGAYPYNESTNYVAFDNYFYADMIKRYGSEAVKNMLVEVKIEMNKQRGNWGS